jgi:uncharacterized protein YigE (DUF2233 family)
MANKTNTKVFGLYLCIAISLLASFLFYRNAVAKSKVFSQSDSLQFYIDEYSRLNDEIVGYMSAISLAKENDSINKHNSILLASYKIDLNSFKAKRDSALKISPSNDSLVKSTNLKFLFINDSIIKNITKNIDYVEKDIKERKVNIPAKNIVVFNEPLIKSCIEKIQKLTDKTEGEVALDILGIKYHIFVVNLDSHYVRMHLYNPKSKKNFGSLGAVKEYLESQKIKPLMITNAGMYTPEYKPEGLYIEENSKTYFELDTLNPKGNLNFYLKPNGVFFIDSANTPHIVKTEDYKKATLNLRVKLATQSGPMLVIDKKLHPSFKQGSKNYKIRSGVGIINNRKIVFAVTKGGSNFYDFGLFFKDIYKCENALFLDGAISLMYLSNEKSANTGGNFGPIISVSKK